MSIISVRLKQAMENSGMRQAQLSKQTGIGKSSISTYLTGAYDPKQENIYKMAKALHVSPEWLAGHDVPMEETFQQPMTDEVLKFALFNSTDGITDEMLAEVKAFAQFVKQKNG